MTISVMCLCKRCRMAWCGVRAVVALLCATVTLLPPSGARAMQTSAAFVVAGSQFHQRGPEDAGEARICIQNTGGQPLATAQLGVRILAHKTVEPETQATECRCVYVKLSPPLLQPGRYGEILVKLMDAPRSDCRLTCDVSVGAQAIPHSVPLAEPDLWISYVGFSQDLRRVFVYLENPGQEPAEARLLRVGQFDVAGQATAIHVPIPPKDKGCLIGDLPSSLAAGEFVHVTAAIRAGGRESNVFTVVRVIPAVPIVREGGTTDPSMGLDVQRPFLETMACPAHAHGTHEAAAAKFLDGYSQQFLEDPSKPIQIAVCRANMPKAWYRFGDLPDVAAVNTCLGPPPSYDKDPQKWFCPFSCVGNLAKRATEPGRFAAIIPTGPDVEDGSFLLKGLTPQEWRFLVCCALASGAKGVIYRGLPGGDLLSRDAFSQLNKELQQLKPLLSIAEPVAWMTTREGNYAAAGLLCGDQAILAMVFDCRFFSRQKDGKFHTPSFGRAVAPVQIRGKLPRGIAVQDVATPFASLDRSCWDCREGVLEFTADMVDSVQVYVISIRPQVNPVEEGLSQ